MTGLTSLIEKLEKAEGPNRELDRAIQCGFGGWHRVTPSQARNKHGAFIAPEDWIGVHSDGSPILDSMHGTTMHRDVPPVTGSVDVALAFASRVLPGFGISIDTHPVYGDWWDASIFNQMPMTIANARKQTGPLALCLATLRALQSKGGEA